MFNTVLAILLFSLSSFAAGGGAKHFSDANVGFPNKFNKTVVTPLKKVVLAEPTMNAKVPAGNITLKWGASDGADSFHVQVATDANFKWIVAEKSLLSANSFQVSGLESGKTYFWRVAAMKSDNNPEYLKGPFSVSVFDVQ